jgi:hypothetical protein
LAIAPENNKMAHKVTKTNSRLFFFAK